MSTRPGKAWSRRAAVRRGQMLASRRVWRWRRTFPLASAWRAENAERRLDGLGGSREYRAVKLRHVAVLFSRTRASTAVDRGEAA